MGNENTVEKTDAQQLPSYPEGINFYERLLLEYDSCLKQHSTLQEKIKTHGVNPDENPIEIVNINTEKEINMQKNSWREAVTPDDQAALNTKILHKIQFVQERLEKIKERNIKLEQDVQEAEFKAKQKVWNEIKASLENEDNKQVFSFIKQVLDASIPLTVNNNVSAAGKILILGKKHQEASQAIKFVEGILSKTQDSSNSLEGSTLEEIEKNYTRLKNIQEHYKPLASKENREFINEFSKIQKVGEMAKKIKEYVPSSGEKLNEDQKAALKQAKEIVEKLDNIWAKPRREIATLNPNPNAQDIKQDKLEDIGKLINDLAGLYENSPASIKSSLDVIAEQYNFSIADTIKTRKEAERKEKIDDFKKKLSKCQLSLGISDEKIKENIEALLEYEIALKKNLGLFNSIQQFQDLRNQALRISVEQRESMDEKQLAEIDNSLSELNKNSSQTSCFINLGRAFAHKNFPDMLTFIRQTNEAFKKLNEEIAKLPKDGKERATLEEFSNYLTACLQGKLYQNSNFNITEFSIDISGCFTDPDHQMGNAPLLNDAIDKAIDAFSEGSSTVLDKILQAIKGIFGIKHENQTQHRLSELGKFFKDQQSDTQQPSPADERPTVGLRQM